MSVGMKKFFGAFVVCAFFCAAECFSAEPAGESALPKIAFDFVGSTFAGARIADVRKDSGWFSTDYLVTLSDSTSVEFDGAGYWREISNKSGLSLKLLPARIAELLEVRFIGAKVVRIKKTPRIFSVYFADGRRLDFDSNLNLLEVAD